MPITTSVLDFFKFTNHIKSLNLQVSDNESSEGNTMGANKGDDNIDNGDDDDGDDDHI